MIVSHSNRVCTTGGSSPHEGYPSVYRTLQQSIKYILKNKISQDVLFICLPDTWAHIVITSSHRQVVKKKKELNIFI